MRFIQPSVEYWQQEAGIEGVWKQIAKATRVSYQSKAREGENDLDFVKRVIFKPALIEGDLDDLEHCEFDNNKGHFSVLEHGTVYLTIPNAFLSFHQDVLNCPYSKQRDDGYMMGKTCITTNMRVLIENNDLGILRYLTRDISCHFKRYTFNVITDIGVTREMNRHRRFSVVEQSTRYCDFSKDRFGGELTIIKPAWIKEPIYLISDNTIAAFELMCTDSERAYRELRQRGWKPEQARQVLPLGLKTQAVYTAYAQDWQHFLLLRSSQAVSGTPHPNIKIIADKIAEIAKEQKLW